MSKIYFYTKGGGFYSDAIDAHGPRTIMINDPSQPDTDHGEEDQQLIEVENPLCKLPPAEDLVEITWAEHKALMDAQAAGKWISIGSDGKPIAVDPPPPTRDQLAAGEEAWLSDQVQLTEPLVSRHRDEKDMDEPTTLSAVQFSELLAYRKALRAWPDNEAFPASDKRPAPPAWIEPTP